MHRPIHEFWGVTLGNNIKRLPIRILSFLRSLPLPFNFNFLKKNLKFTSPNSGNQWANFGKGLFLKNKTKQKNTNHTQSSTMEYVEISDPLVLKHDTQILLIPFAAEGLSLIHI